MREKESSPSGRRTQPPQEQHGVCVGVGVELRGDIENFHITWGPVISLSSMFPSGGKRESQGADNAEGDRNHDENGIPNSWQPRDYYNTVSIPPHPVSALGSKH